MNKKTITIVIAAIVLVGAGIALYFFVFAADKGEEEIKLTYYPIADPFTTNVAESSSLFRAGIVIALNTDNSAVIVQLDENIALIRNTIISILRGLTPEDIDGESSMRDTAAKIKSALNKTLTFEDDRISDVVEDIMFTDYFMQ